MLDRLLTLALMLSLTRTLMLDTVLMLTLTLLQTLTAPMMPVLWPALCVQRQQH